MGGCADRIPGWTEEKLYSVNKVLNEYDVAPLEYLHALMDGLG